ncbi:MAG: isoprenylcysteine carboxylmethyltransferase family protein [Acidobacteriaceae bacterium]
MLFFRDNPLLWIWAVFGVLWMLPAAFTKKTVQKQGTAARISQLALLVTAYVLLTDVSLGWDFLNNRLIPQAKAVPITGYVLLAAGLLFAVWARVHLRGNWSSDAVLRQDHTLIDSGPYRLVRHPIYTGLLLALVGTSLVLGAELRCLLGVVLAAIAWKFKSNNEEALMVKKFGDRYVRYRTQVKGLVPYIW